ncbi:VTT domain-containing protein [Ruminococcaceae bacterium OttesenSCG-928-A11]|nr:VTT domain-containing protein [Ruminococcaceae bacterium OttesenSCG-928-A11]
MEKAMKYIKIGFVAAVVIAIILLAPRLRGLDAQAILSYTPASLPLAALVMIGIYAAKSVLMIIPTYGLYLAGGMLFPTGWAIVVAYAGLAVELSLGFWAGRWLGRDKIVALMEKNAKAKRFITFLDGNSQMVCFATRVLPMPYPVDLGSMFFGASGMGFWRHLVFSLLGFSAVMIPITIAGSHLSNPLSAEFLVPFGISITIAVGLFVVYLLWQRRQKKKADGADETPAD